MHCAERLASFVEHDHIAGARLRPVQAKGQHQVPIIVAGHGHREVIVDTFFEFVIDRKAQRCSQVDPGLADRIGFVVKRMHGH